MNSRNNEPVFPPGNAIQFCGMHWLEKRSFNEVHGYIALQWNPGSKTWTHSDDQDKYNTKVFDTRGWRYLCPIPHWLDLIDK